MRVLFILLLLTGCQTAPKVVTIEVPIEVKVPVPVPCIAVLPARPALTSDDELAGMGDYAFILALRRNGLSLAVYAAELEAVLLACRTP
jgi:hypothetical protein